jgi:hypothetical protein
MKVGDLVVHSNTGEHNFGVGLVVKFLFHDDFGDARWGVLWNNPRWTQSDGTSVTYESEVKVINESR